VYRRADGTPGPWCIQLDERPVEHYFPTAKLEVGNADALMQALVRGLGVSQLPTWVIEGHLQRGELVEIMPSYTVQGLPLYLLWTRSRQSVPKVDALVKHLAGTLSV